MEPSKYILESFPKLPAVDQVRVMTWMLKQEKGKKIVQYLQDNGYCK